METTTLQPPAHPAPIPGPSAEPTSPLSPDDYVLLTRFRASPASPEFTNNPAFDDWILQPRIKAALRKAARASRERAFILTQIVREQLLTTASVLLASDLDSKQRITAIGNITRIFPRPTSKLAANPKSPTRSREEPDDPDDPDDREDCDQFEDDSTPEDSDQLEDDPNPVGSAPEEVEHHAYCPCYKPKPTPAPAHPAPFDHPTRGDHHNPTSLHSLTPPRRTPVSAPPPAPPGFTPAPQQLTPSSTPAASDAASTSPHSNAAVPSSAASDHLAAPQQLVPSSAPAASDAASTSPHSNATVPLAATQQLVPSPALTAHGANSAPSDLPQPTAPYPPPTPSEFAPPQPSPPQPIPEDDDPFKFITTLLYNFLFTLSPTGITDIIDRFAPHASIDGHAVGTHCSLADILYTAPFGELRAAAVYLPGKFERGQTLASFHLHISRCDPTPFTPHSSPHPTHPNPLDNLNTADLPNADPPNLDSPTPEPFNPEPLNPEPLNPLADTPTLNAPPHFDTIRITAIHQFAGPGRLRWLIESIDLLPRNSNPPPDPPPDPTPNSS